MKKPYADIAGWAAMILLLGDYLLLSLGLLGLGYFYFAINIVAGMCMTLHGYERRAWPMVAANAIFAGIGILGLIWLVI